MNIFKNWQQVILFICFCRINAVHKPSFNYSTSTEARVKFEKQFINKCQKYPFVQKFQEMLRRPFSNYLIFVYHEPGQSSNGGLGDRLAGMITALAFAIRSNRTFLIVGDESFEKSFRPYYDNSLSFGRSEPSWANW